MASRQKKHGRTARSGGAGTVRIIAGDWRGRRLPVLDAPGLRPTGDRARETLFNWLQGKTYGARCADLFAGSGALGFEAASRGARPVTLVERSRSLAESLRETASSLAADQVGIFEGDALGWLAQQAPASLDLVFVDPPFDTDLADRALEALAGSSVLADGALVYLECPRGGAPANMHGFLEEKSKTLGDVEMRLLAAQ